MPSVVIRFEVLPEIEEIPKSLENICHAKKVILVARAVIAKLNNIIPVVNVPPLFRNHKQLTIASSEAKMIAVSPPKTKNDKKIAASEKLTAKFERGIFKLNLVPTIRVRAKRAIKLQSIISASRFKIANTKHTPPSIVKAILKNVEILSRLIDEKND